MVSAWCSSSVNALVESRYHAKLGTNDGVFLQLDGQVIALLIQNIERLDETVKEEADAVHNTLGDLSFPV